MSMGNQVKKYGLIGKTLNYSYSPFIHEEIYRIFDIDATYDLLELTRFEFPKGYDGVNITNPYKKIAYEQSQKVDAFVNYSSAANTWDAKTNIVYNTDKDGLDVLMPSNIKEYKSVLIIGTGSTASMTALVFYMMGIRDIRFLTRSVPSVDIGEYRMIPDQMIRTYDKKTSFFIDRFVSYEDVMTYEPVGKALLCNCSPIGTKGMGLTHCFDSSFLSRFDYVMDIVYNPLETPLIEMARSQNVPAVGGLKMLVVQALEAEIIWNDLTISAQRKERLIDLLYAKTERMIHETAELSAKTE